MMDPEPGRCRRTDGKKWRCSKEVVPNQKYCERHMHRGRQRSRKPVEASEITSPSNAIPPLKSNNDPGTSIANHFISTSVNLQLVTPSSNSTSTSNYFTTTTATTAITTTSGNNVSNKNVSGNNDTTTAAVTTTTASAATTVTSSTTNHHTVDIKDNCGNHVDYNYIISRHRNSGNNLNVGNTVPPGLGFSPKSVLQVSGCCSSCLDHSSSIHLEPGRCRRTDGKKWRCSKNIVPHQKYCRQHMHRGAKKHAGASQPVAVRPASTAATSSAWPLLATTIVDKADSAILNTNLSISIPASPQLIANDGKSTTSSSSDTTITDTSITTNEN